MRKFQNNMHIWNGKAVFGKVPSTCLSTYLGLCRICRKNLTPIYRMYSLDNPMCLALFRNQKTIFSPKPVNRYSVLMFQYVMEYCVLSLMIPVCKMCSLYHVSISKFESSPVLSTVLSSFRTSLCWEFQKA